VIWQLGHCPAFEPICRHMPLKSPAHAEPPNVTNETKYIATANARILTPQGESVDADGGLLDPGRLNSLTRHPLISPEACKRKAER
jgi:hypothetical protein